MGGVGVGGELPSIEEQKWNKKGHNVRRSENGLVEQSFRG
jgi:hypothetical protein